MKDRDTVLPDEQIRATCLGEGFYWVGDLQQAATDSSKILMPQFRRVAEAQAEVSFKMGIKEASEIYDKYVALLEAELSGIVGLAFVHGWRSKRYDDGVKCREEIAALKERGIIDD